MSARRAAAYFRSVLSHSCTNRRVSSDACLTGLTSNHARGTAFEHLSIKVLSNLPLDLSINHKGGAGDQGVDFIGDLNLKHQPSEQSLHRWFPVIGQCKYEQKPMGPIHLRSLEGSINNFQSKYEKSNNTVPDVPLIGFMVSAQPFSTQALSQWKRSPCPIILVVIDPTFQVAESVSPSVLSNVDLAQPDLAVSSFTFALKRFSLNPVAQRLIPSITVDRFHDEAGVLRIIPYQNL